MKLTITLPANARLAIDDEDWHDQAEADDLAADTPVVPWAGQTQLMPAIANAHPPRLMFGEPGAPADLDRRTPLDCIITADAIAYRSRQPADSFGTEYMPGGGYLVAYASRRAYDHDGSVLEGWWVQTNPDDGGSWFEHAAEAHARIRSVWTSSDVRVFTNRAEELTR